METLDTIQKLSKAGKVFSKIIYVFCLVGIIGTAIGLACLIYIPDGFKLGGVTIHGLIERSPDITLGTCYTVMVMAIIVCIGEAVLAKMAERYFQNELTAGTPFTLEGAKELMRLGICAICIPLGSRIGAEIVGGILSQFLTDAAEIDSFDFVSVGLGLMMIFSSLLCRYGAEILAGKEEA